MQDDRQIRVSGKWAIATDNVQWIAQKRRGQEWRSVKYIRSTRDWLAYRLRFLGCPDADAARLLDGLPDTFAQWLEASHGVFGVAGVPKGLKHPKTYRRRHSSADSEA